MSGIAIEPCILTSAPPLLTAFIVPAFFPIVNPSAEMTFLPAMWQILCKVGPLLLAPFFAAWLLRLSYEGYFRRKGTPRIFALNATWASMPFYLWIVLLIVLIGNTVCKSLRTS